jgi:hypothetical protein
VFLSNLKDLVLHGVKLLPLAAFLGDLLTNLWSTDYKLILPIELDVFYSIVIQGLLLLNHTSHLSIPLEVQGSYKFGDDPFPIDKQEDLGGQ